MPNMTRSNCFVQSSEDTAVGAVYDRASFRSLTYARGDRPRLQYEWSSTGTLPQEAAHPIPNEWRGHTRGEVSGSMHEYTESVATCGSGPLDALQAPVISVLGPVDYVVIDGK